MRVLELYSGVGGHRTALRLHPTITERHGTDSETSQPDTVTAYDVNEHANSVYALNYAHVPSAMDISLLTAELHLDARNGPRLESADMRANSFLSLLKQLPLLKQPPPRILLENVLGFEKSDSFQLFLEVLEDCGYKTQGYLINSNTCGFPNSRPRFYLLAKRAPYAFKHTENNGKHDLVSLEGLTTNVAPNPVSKYLEVSANTDESLRISHRALWKAADQYDIVRPTHSRTCCFTKGYGKYARGSGSVLCMASDDEILEAAVQLGFQIPAISNDFDGTEEARTTSNDGYDSTTDTTAKARRTQIDWTDGQTPAHIIAALFFLFDLHSTLRAKHKPVIDAAQSEPPKINPRTGEPVREKRISAKRKRELDMQRGSWPDSLPASPLSVLRLRYFSVREVARLQGFPDWFQFPEKSVLTNEQCWKLLGNSIHVHVVKGLMNYLLEEGSSSAP
ncbi:C-5 cytosine-specific DNA methylase [Chytriomyces hyalinus]|nr:C-5 cytosine-specific DNA methylase [Chytriomyces hyalinus]